MSKQPDFSKEKFKIVITVCDNCQQMQVTSLLPDYEPSYQEIIGTLELMKINYHYQQTGVNLLAFRKWKEEKGGNEE